MSNEILLDVQQLQPPEPMEKALDALDKIGAGEYIKMVHRMQPFPLYNILMENGFKYKVISKDSGFDIYIWRSDDTESEQEISQL